jgi:hypothetical protein
VGTPRSFVPGLAVAAATLAALILTTPGAEASKGRSAPSPKPRPDPRPNPKPKPSPRPKPHPNPHLEPQPKPKPAPRPKPKPHEKRALGKGRDPRHQPRTVTIQEGVAKVTGKWLRGTHGNAGKMPGQIAENLKGKPFKDFNHFRREFWKAVADNPHLRNQFSRSNQARMAKGLAPYAHESQHLGGRRKYEIHHIKPIHDKGGVYDLNNLMIVTPRYHKEVLAPKYHSGR